VELQVAHLCGAAVQLQVGAKHLELEGARLGRDQLELAVAALVHGRAVARAAAGACRLPVQPRAEHRRRVGTVVYVCREIVPSATVHLDALRGRELAGHIREAGRREGEGKDN
jgi:hypothetical protein